MVLKPEIIDTEVLVIGGGGAGSRAALEARLAGAKVLLTVKGKYSSLGVRGAGATGSALAEWGGFFIDPERGAAHLEPWVDMRQATAEDLAQADYDNIVQVGLGMADPKLARVLTQNALRQRHQLEQWGVPFDGNRLLHHGVPLVARLSQLVREHGVQVLEEVMVTDLLVHQGRCVGATGVDFGGHVLVIKAGAVILATGGDAVLYRYNFHPPCVTGDGYAMAYEAGATLMNMEFGQFFVGTVPSNLQTHTSAILQPAAKITNGLGEEFLSGYVPDGVTVQEVLQSRREHNPFSTRDRGKYFDIAVTKEILAGRARLYGGVCVDLTDPSVSIPGTYGEDWLHYRGIYPDERPVDIIIARHCAHGGLVMDETCQSSLPGLYSAGGEVSAGDHGADRLGGHMLASSQVWGSIAGRGAAQFARAQDTGDVPADVIDHGLERITDLVDRQGEVSPRQVKRQIQQRMWEDMLVVRTQEGCDRVLQMVDRMRQEDVPRLCTKAPMQMVEALEIVNMLTVAEMETRAAEMRTESRGSHSRMDYTERDDANWLRCITIRKGAEKMGLDTVVLDPNWTDRPGDMKHTRWG